jgi:predicted phage terminase large subunit-like protein
MKIPTTLAATKTKPQFHVPKFRAVTASPMMREDKLSLYTVADEMERRLCESSLHAFLQFAWPIMEPGRMFVDNWHLRAISEHLEAVSRREITRLLINVPFRTSKSTITSVAWPAWTWIHDPSHQWLCGSYASKLAIRDNLKMRRLVTSSWYQKHWGSKVRLASDQNEKIRFQNESMGYRIAFGMTGGVMGDGGDTVLIDDPHDRNGAHSEAERETALTTFDEGIISRLNDPIDGAICIIMQRLHQNDLSGHVLKQGGWDHLMLPMEYEPQRRCKTSIGFQDPRKKDGELLWTARFDESTVEKLKRSLGSYGAAGQLAQRPAPDGGGILNTEFFELWPRNKDLPDLFFVLQSYDTAFTEKHQVKGDPSAGTIWGIGEHEFGERKGKKFAILLDAWADQLSYPNLKKKVMEDWQATYGGIKDDQLHPSRRPDAILIEKKASGQSLIQDLRARNLPVQDYDPGRADKVARAHMTAPFLEDCVFYLIESKKDPGKPVTWARPLVEQCEQFPNGEHDDLVDTFTQACIYFRDSGFLEFEVIPDDEVEEIDYATQRKARQNPYKR